MGYSNPSRKGRLCLYPEEALYLLEKGTIWIHWEGLEEIPMSVQEAFSNLLNPSADSSSLKPHTTLSKYLVYSYLRTLGFTVRPLTCSVSRSRNVVSHFQSPPRPVSWPLIHLGLYASAGENILKAFLYTFSCPLDGALRDLARMSHRWDPATDPADAQTVAGYNLYRPSQHPSILFRKSDPPEPHLRVIIQDVSCPFPSCDEIASWTRSYGSQTLIAVVDACHISFLSLDTSGPIAPLKNI